MRVVTGVPLMMAGGAVGEIDLDVGVALTDSQNPPAVSPIMIGPSTDTVLGSFRLRVVRNQATPTTANLSTFRIGLRHSSAGGVRNSVISGVGDNLGRNILGRWDSVIPPVLRTDVSLFLSRPDADFVRIGDIIPITLKLRANTDARHIDTIQAQVQLPAAFQVVRGATDPTTLTEADHPLSPASSDLLTRNGPATGTFVLATANYSMGMPDQGVPQTVSFDVTGPNALTIPQGQERTIGTFYVRPMQKTTVGPTSPLTMALCQKWSDRIGQRIGTSVNFGPTPPMPTTGFVMQCQALPSELASPTDTCPWSCPTLQNLSVGPVRGTTGVSLEFRSPLSSTPSLLDNAGWVAQDPTKPLGTDQPVVPVTVGRYLDVKVIVNAGTDDVRTVDTFLIDLENGSTNFAMADNPVRGIDFALNPSLSYGPTNGTQCAMLGMSPMSDGEYNLSLIHI